MNTIRIEAFRSQEILAEGETTEAAIRAFAARLQPGWTLTGLARMDHFRTALRGDMAPGVPLALEALLVGRTFEQASEDMAGKWPVQCGPV